ncbi:MAG: phosphate/phosphite/phosphonate ABC transporter substrate-binding protein [Chloroflexota bacterium]
MGRIMRTVSIASIACAVISATLIAACGVGGGAALGTKDNPIKMAFVPSSDSQKVLASGEPLGQLLEQETGYSFKVSVPTSYAAVIEAMGANNVDVGWLATFAYVLARDKFGTEAILATVRQGSKTYTGEIIVHADSGINSLDQLRGKKFAFVDPSSASGYLYPNALLKQKLSDYSDNFFSERIFAGGHDKVVIAVHSKQVDAGATFGDSVIGGPPTDARIRVQGTIPDVMEKVKVIAITDPIPNDTVSVRKGLAPEMITRLREGLLKVAQSDDGKKALKDLYQIDGLAPSSDADYNPVREAARVLNLNLEQELAPRPKP